MSDVHIRTNSAYDANIHHWSIFYFKQDEKNKKKSKLLCCRCDLSILTSLLADICRQFFCRTEWGKTKRKVNSGNWRGDDVTEYDQISRTFLLILVPWMHVARTNVICTIVHDIKHEFFLCLIYNVLCSEATCTLCSLLPRRCLTEVTQVSEKTTFCFRLFRNL